MLLTWKTAELKHLTHPDTTTFTTAFMDSFAQGIHKCNLSQVMEISFGHPLLQHNIKKASFNCA